MGLLSSPTAKKLNFTNPERQTAAMLKTVKSPYLCNRLTDFDEIWHVTNPYEIWYGAWKWVY